MASENPSKTSEQRTAERAADDQATATGAAGRGNAAAEVWREWPARRPTTSSSSTTAAAYATNVADVRQRRQDERRQHPPAAEHGNSEDGRVGEQAELLIEEQTSHTARNVAKLDLRRRPVGRRRD